MSNENPWWVYDLLLEGVPEDETVANYQVGVNWSWVESSSGHVGMAMTYPLDTGPGMVTAESLDGMSLREVGELAKSWNFCEAAVGLAAINSWYNAPERAGKVGRPHPADEATPGRDGFDVYREEMAGKKVAVVGHFKGIEKQIGDVCELSILERQAIPGDYPDPACEYLLPSTDYLFVTSSTLVNKTFTRLLELAKDARVVMVGPSTPITDRLFDAGVWGLSGMIPTNPAGIKKALRGVGTQSQWDHGRMVSLLAK